MAVLIRYCTSWGYEKRAASLAAAIRDSVGLETTIEPGNSGEFTVTSDGDLLFSKQEVGRFPEEAEVLQKLRASPASGDAV